MRLRTYNYTIDVTLQFPNCKVPINTMMVIKAVSVNRTQAIKIAEILNPDAKVLDVKFVL